MSRLVLLSFITLLCACERQPYVKELSTNTPPSILKPCAGFSEIGKPPLVYGAECGELSVKENPADNTSRNISLNILRLPSISPTGRTDPLFFIQGGPGGSSVNLAKQLHWYFSDVRATRDLIFIDQRGTGQSNPMNCTPLSEAEQALPEAQQAAIHLAHIKNCAEKYRQQVNFYTTPYAARDLEEVRRALGYDRINLWGGSYGTRVALEYMRQFPNYTRVSILDGVAPVHIALPKHFHEDAMAALQAVNNECQQNSKCAQLFGDIVEKAMRVTERLTEQAGGSIKIMLEHPRHQQLNPVTLTAKNFSTLIFIALYSRDLTVLLPRAIANAERYDYRLLGALLVLATEQTTAMSIAEGMHYTVICNEDAKLISSADLSDPYAFFGTNMVKDRADICAHWPKAILPESYWAPIKSDIPTLLLSGGHDPVTPVRWADLVAQHLTQATQLTAPGGNHAVSTEGCLPKIIAYFIEKGSMQNIDTSCVNKIKPLPLILGANERAASLSSLPLPSVAPELPK